LVISIISKRVGDLSAGPPDACSRAADQLTGRDARLLQSPRSGDLPADTLWLLGLVEAVAQTTPD
jgi:hypothetical protein